MASIETVYEVVLEYGDYEDNERVSLGVFTDESVANDVAQEYRVAFENSLDRDADMMFQRIVDDVQVRVVPHPLDERPVAPVKFYLGYPPQVDASLRHWNGFITAYFHPETGADYFGCMYPQHRPEAYVIQQAVAAPDSVVPFETVAHRIERIEGKAYAVATDITMLISVSKEALLAAIQPVQGDDSQ